MVAMIRNLVLAVEESMACFDCIYWHCACLFSESGRYGGARGGYRSSGRLTFPGVQHHVVFANIHSSRVQGILISGMAVQLSSGWAASRSKCHGLPVTALGERRNERSRADIVVELQKVQIYKLHLLLEGQSREHSVFDLFQNEMILSVALNQQ